MQILIEFFGVWLDSLQYMKLCLYSLLVSILLAAPTSAGVIDSSNGSLGALSQNGGLRAHGS